MTDSDEELIPQDAGQRLREQLRIELLDASPESLTDERNLFELLDWLAESGGESGLAHVRVLLAHDGIVLAILQSSLTEITSQAVGHVAFRSEQALPWDRLEAIFGQELLRRRLQEVSNSVDRSAQDPRTLLALDTALRYLQGWHPSVLPRARSRSADTAGDRPSP